MNQPNQNTFVGEVALFHGPDSALERLTVQWPQPEGREVLVEISHCAICRSDVHTMCGRRKVHTPTVLGHEIIGTIVAFGADALRTDLAHEALQIGDRITWAIYAHCGNCFFCKNGLPQKCEHLFKYGHEPVLTTGEGSSGGMANYILLKPGTPILKLPESISSNAATPINCAVSTAVAMLRECELTWEACTKIGIMGGGYAGLCAVAMAKARGCGRVVVFETNKEIFARAFAFGADEVYHPNEFDVEAWRAKDGNHRGLDAVLELAGSTPAADLGLRLLRTGGRLILAGTVFPSPALSMDPDQIVRRSLVIKGNHNYRPQDLVEATRFMAQAGTSLPWCELIGREYSLAESQAAVEYAKTHPGMRAIIRMGIES